MKTKFKWLAILILLVVMLAAQIYKDISGEINEKNMTWADWYWQARYTSTNAPPLVDNPALYGDDALDVEVTPLYVTVLPGQDDQGRGVTFRELNEFTDFNASKPVLPAIFSTSAAAGARDDAGAPTPPLP